MIGALLKKDWRLNRVVVVAGLILSSMPYALSLANLWLNPPKYQTPGAREYLDTAQGTAAACLILVVLLAAAFGGLAFAGERRERTAEFLAMLPVSRGQIVVSKLVVALLCLAGLLALHAAVFVVTDAWADWAGVGKIRGPSLYEGGGMAVAFTVAVFGVAWALSVFLNSPAIAACIAIAVGVGLLFGGMAWAEKAFEAWDEMNRTNTSEAVMLTVVCVASAAVGFIAIAGSSVRYVRRVAP
jgi:ABC-type transport system involved in multi-copper enzyme maturation permease subunit